MAKKRNNRRQQARPVSNSQKPENSAAQALASVQLAEKTAPVTIEDVLASANQAEFEAKKETLIQQLLDEISEYDEIKKASEAAAESAKTALNDLEEENKALEAQRDELKQDFDNASKTVREASEQAEKLKSEADKYSEDTRSAADAYADETRRDADADRLKKLKEAADEAKKAWQTQIDDLNKQINEIAEREGALQEAQRK